MIEDIILIKLGRLFNMCREGEKFSCRRQQKRRNTRKFHLAEISFNASYVKAKKVSSNNRNELFSYRKLSSISPSSRLAPRMLLTLRNVTGADKNEAFFCSYINYRVEFVTGGFHSLSLNLSELIVNASSARSREECQKHSSAMIPWITV